MPPRARCGPAAAVCSDFPRFFGSTGSFLGPHEISFINLLESFLALFEPVVPVVCAEFPVLLYLLIKSSSLAASGPSELPFFMLLFLRSNVVFFDGAKWAQYGSGVQSLVNLDIFDIQRAIGWSISLPGGGPLPH